jgi:NitT/TauT family transport system ATP-binding protein
MCQRVGFARALVVNPEILLMDEPFSALDVLTADNLRSDLLDLWQCDKTNIKTILLVTHNIEEAALLADRILIFGTNPGGVKAELSVEMPHPRNTKSTDFHALVEEIYMLLTAPRNKSSGVLKPRIIDFTHRLPKAEISELTGLLETLVSPEYSGKVELAQLAEELLLGVNDLFPLTEALEILRFATISDGDIQLTEIGKQFAEADILQRKKIFAGQLLNFVPLARHVRQVLDERPRHKASEDRFLEELEDHLSVEAAEEVLKVVIDWGRYAELFAYDYNKGILSLEDPT